MNGISATGSAPALSLQDSLNLITTQLRNQDPLQPTDDSQLVSQITQINQSEQISKLADSVNSMATSARVTEATALIGKTVDATGANGTAISGAVTGVTVQNGVPQVQVNGSGLGLDSITKIH